LEEECTWANRGFFHRITLGRPWVMLKVAASLDGKIALQNGESKWITCEESRRNAQLLRAENDALITGVSTVLADNPKLTVRDVPGRTPLRVILDGSLRTPLDAALFDSEPERLLFFADASVSEEKARLFKEKGADVETIGSLRRNLRQVLEKLGEKGVNYLMVEAGASLVSSFLNEKLADSLSLFIAPKLLGDGKGFSDMLHFDTMDAVSELKQVTTKQSGSDIWLEGVFACSRDSSKQSAS
jgi:diaminohydroxyphosphoribosylaminopyrimidine deaminase/5-amino-6-(5-phosphoribosylamino)uracil reductase